MWLEKNDWKSVAIKFFKAQFLLMCFGWMLDKEKQVTTKMRKQCREDRISTRWEVLENAEMKSSEVWRQELRHVIYCMEGQPITDLPHTPFAPHECYVVNEVE